MTDPSAADPTRAARRRQLLARGHAIATRLAEVLAGKDGERGLRALGLHARPGMRPEEVLRAALDRVETLRRWLDAGDDRYGRCHACGAALSAAQLDEVPWADACPAHA
ncbi:MAG TPA: hypothetical protein VM734_04870 [Kofleriaceae bacterium]|nr:hypothetical protein [Kofleriaceae bacterium]